MGNRGSSRQSVPEAQEEAPQLPALAGPAAQRPSGVPSVDVGIRVVCPTCRHTLIPPHLEVVFACPCGQPLQLVPPSTTFVPHRPPFVPSGPAFFLAPQALPPPGHPQYNAALYAHAIMSRLPQSGGAVDVRALQSLMQQLERERKGTTQDVLELFPTRAWVDPPPGSTLSEEARSCGVCMEPYEAEQVVRTLPCLHVFHVACCDPWLRENRVCPLCRYDVAKGTSYQDLPDTQQQQQQQQQVGGGAGGGVGPPRGGPPPPRPAPAAAAGGGGAPGALPGGPSQPSGQVPEWRQ